ncbi:MAG: hypothetical protein NVV74_02145 [Magnetospirillum sp.]|nr:hypothetical protein [Magnetospirillum sp.]
MWRLPIPFCLPLFRFGLAVGLAVAMVGAFLPWGVPVAVLVAMVASPRLADATSIIRATGRTFDVRLTEVESIARRFRDVARLP